MAEIQLKSKGKRTLTPRVDLTPMVDLVFLLITFFMFTSVMTNPVAMDLQMPYKPAPSGNTAFYESSAITLIPAKGSKVFYYNGLYNAAIPMQAATNNLELRAVLQQRQSEIRNRKVVDERTLQVLIKPSDDSNLNNLVSVLDEMSILSVTTYAIVDLSKEEWNACVDASNN